MNIKKTYTVAAGRQVNADRAYLEGEKIDLGEEHMPALVACGAVVEHGEAAPADEPKKEEPAPAPVADSSAAPAATADTGATAQGSEPAALRYHHEHRGAGRWYVIDETGEQEPIGPFSKDEAAAKADELNQPGA